ncbi:hypothetical protein [Bradyrhizobium zhanjiangense]|uniref:hypothetical protein n=1 Tax=Bradyrhizobium zhanjiangense TaxID=1325107 RepID=UPI0013E8D907|nr:hypothetical protein [Bradyrhizobium zhanjiangense]
MIVIAGALGGLGAAYGIATSSGPWMAALFAIAYGTVGILLGVPFAGFLNLTRRLWQ